MKIYILLLLLFFNFFYASYVKSVLITGLERTNESLIKDQISHPINTTFNLDIAQNDFDNLMDLQSFSDISIQNYDSLYHVKLKEIKLTTWEPIIDKDKMLGMTYGFKINFNNIRGNTNKFTGEIISGGTNKYIINFTDTRIGKTKNKLKIKFYNETYKDLESIYTLKNKTALFNILFFKNNFNFKLKFYENIIENINNDKYQYINPSIEYFNQEVLFTNNYSNHIFNLEYEYHHSINNKPNYHIVNFELLNYIQLIKSSSNPKFLYKIKANLNSKSNSPIYEQNYLGGDYNVRSYDIIPSLNPFIVQNKLKFLNTIITTSELHLPVNVKIPYITSIKQSNLLIFVDYGVGSQSYKRFNMNNKIKGYGFGINFVTKKNKTATICIGLNQYHQKEIHFTF